VKSAALIVTACALLAACAAPRPPAAVAPVPPAAAAPRTMTTDLMADLVSADMELQTGKAEKAYAILLDVARKARDPRVAQRAMEVAIGANRGPDALAAIALWLEIEPDSEEAQQYYLGFMLLDGQFDKARPLLAAKLAQSPDERGLAMYQVQRFLSRARDQRGAFALLDELLTPYGASLESHLVLAQGAHAAGDHARALREAQAARALAPASELAVLTHAQVLADPAAQERVAAEFLATHADAREVRHAHARMLINLKRYAEARSELERVLAAEPGNITVLYALGVLCMETDDNAAAERYLTAYMDALDARPDPERDPARAIAALAQLAQDRGDAAKAQAWLARLETVAGRKGIYFAAQLRRAQQLAKQGDLKAARALLNGYETADSNEQARLLQAEAQLLRDARQTALAYRVLEQGAQRYPDDADLLYDYAIAAEGLGRSAAMEKALRRVMELAPANQHAYNALGFALAERNQRLPEAQALIEKALQLAPGDPFIMDSLGWAHFRQGRLGEAEDLLRKAYAAQPDAEIATHLAEVLWRRGQLAEAHALWKAARAKDPKNPALRSTLARLNVKLK
jgi:tetratricopeptide (TPR) repeat protein